MSSQVAGSAAEAVELESEPNVELVARLEALADGRTLDKLDAPTLAAMDRVIAEQTPVACERPSRPAQTPPKPTVAEALRLLAVWKAAGPPIPTGVELDAMSDEREAWFAGVPHVVSSKRREVSFGPRQVVRLIVRPLARARGRRARRSALRRSPSRSSPGSEPEPPRRHDLGAAA